jgi:CheY-like chemotaxis protein
MKSLFSGASYFMIKPDVKFAEKSASDPNLDYFIEELTYYIWNVIRMRKNFFEKEEMTLAEDEIVNYLVANDKFSSGNEQEVLDTNILVVDDEPEIRTAIKEYLEQEGFLKIDTAENGEEAIKKFEKKRHPVVVVDIVMPKKNGIDVLRDIRARSMSSQVIIITGNADKDSAIAAVKLGAFDYIEKPFDYGLIAKVIRKASEKNLLLEGLD